MEFSFLKKRSRFGVLLLSYFIVLCFAAEIVEEDNIAVEQSQIPAFAVPAPGIRFGNRRRVKPTHSFASNNHNAISKNAIESEFPRSEPTLVSIDVSCQPKKMLVSLAFDKPFSGIVYSKGYYGVRECMHVKPHGGRRKINFEVDGEGCGSQYIESPGQPAYLENVIIVQNEPNIQELWDTARGLRCLLGGAIGQGRSRQTVSAALNVATLEQQVVTFATDAKASASMDIQVGHGPFAPSASGLVKIGELMTMVVSVDGPKEVDVLVRQCIAHDGTNDNTIDLTDVNGCVLKRKIIGAWQKQKMEVTPKTDSPVYAFAHFQAFKFPDKMDVYIECEVDLCYGECPICAEDEANSIGRNRRSLPEDGTQNDAVPGFQEAVDKAEGVSFTKKGKSFENDGLRNSSTATYADEKTVTKASESSGLRLAKRLRVLSPEDISVNGDEFSSITLVTRTSSGDEFEEEICMSLVSFICGIVAMFIILIASSVLTAILCIKVRTIPYSSSSFPPNSSFHAFSTVSGKNT